MKLQRRTLLMLSAAGVPILPEAAMAFPNGQADAPRFKAKSIDGVMFDNASLMGKVLLVQFWATWCGYCRRDQPEVDAVVAEHGQAGLVVLAVNTGEGKRKVQQYLEASPRKGHVVLLPDTNLAAGFRADVLPYYVAINRAGKVAKEQRGAAGARGLESLLTAAGLG